MKLSLTLPDSIASAQDLGSLQAEVKEYANWYAHESIKKQVGTGKTSNPPIVSDAAKHILSTWNAAKPLDRRGFDELLATLKSYDDNAQTITITLAAPAPNALKMTLVAWCRANIAPNVLVNFQFNATILGGMVVRSGSRVFDWSFRRQLLAARQNFPEVLRRV